MMKAKNAKGIFRTMSDILEEIFEEIVDSDQLFTNFSKQLGQGIQEWTK